VPLSSEVFSGSSGQKFTADVNTTTTLADLATLLPVYDLSAFSGDRNSIVYVSQAAVPASEFVTLVPEPSTLARSPECLFSKTPGRRPLRCLIPSVEPYALHR
jgi:hypothetical protein